MTVALGSCIHELAQAVNIVTVNATLLEEAIPEGPLRELAEDLQAAAQRLPLLLERLRAM